MSTFRWNIVRTRYRKAQSQMSTTLETPVVRESHTDPQLPDSYVGREADVTFVEDWVPKPTCEGCHLEMQPIGRGGWWCEPCQVFQ